MLKVSIADYIVWLANPAPADHWLIDSAVRHAALVDEEGSDRYDGDPLFIAVNGGPYHPPSFLVVRQRYHSLSAWIGEPGILLVPETHLLLIGAGERLLAYDLREPKRLWEDKAAFGFHSWHQHGDIIVMSAEVELVAWDIHGAKRWGVDVEPPWDYQVEDGMVYLDVMGQHSSFPLRTGPVR